MLLELWESDIPQTPDDIVHTASARFAAHKHFVDSGQRLIIRQVKANKLEVSNPNNPGPMSRD